MQTLVNALRRVIAKSYQIGMTYEYDTVVKCAQQFGNPNILHDSAFSHLFKPGQKFILQKIDVDRLEAGNSKKEYPHEVMWLESGPEYDDEGKLIGGDEFYAQKFANKYPSSTTAGPIIVTKVGSRFKIIDGRHRARAAFLRGEKKIEAFVALDF